MLRFWVWGSGFKGAPKIINPLVFGRLDANARVCV